MMPRSGRLQRVSRVMRYICLFGVWISPVCLLVLWFSDGDTSMKMIAHHAHLNTDNISITFTTRVLGFLINSISVAIIIYSLIQLGELFRLYSEGEIFGSDNVNRFLKFARSLFALGIINPVVGGLLSVILTMNNPPGERQFAIGFGSGDASNFFIATIFLVIAWVMAEGHELSKENAQII